jgi:chemotaxis protein CheD
MEESAGKNNMIGIGEIRVIQGEEDVVWTVLGSCISVIFFTNQNLSLICHAQMPSRGDFDSMCSDSCPHPCFNNLPDSMELKYVNCSIEYMIDVMKKKNINTGKISTTLIGGASVIETSGESKTIGEQNVQMAKQILENNGIAINRQLVGGKKGYTIWFNSRQNTVFYRRHGTNEKVELR